MPRAHCALPLMGLLLPIASVWATPPEAHPVSASPVFSALHSAAPTAELSAAPAAELSAALTAEISAANEPPASAPLLDDATLHAEHEAYQKSLAGQEWFDVGYIRVPTEEAAKAVIARLKTGADFAQQAAQHSTDSRSRADGGRLGRFASCRWSRATLELLNSVSTGSVAPKPLPGTHGWGVYKLFAREPLKPLDFATWRDAFLTGKLEAECPWQPPSGATAQTLRSALLL